MLLRTLFAAFCMTCAGGYAIQIGYVDFQEVLTQSQFAKKEEQSLQALRADLEGQVTKLEKEMASIGEKLRDPDYIDSLSPEAEQEQKEKFRRLGEERMQLIQVVSQQYQQATQRFVANMAAQVSAAAAAIAKDEGLEAVFNKEALFTNHRPNT